MKIGQKTFDLTKPVLMGIVNVTPDSFSDGGQFFSADKALRHIETLIAAGADIIDIGAESTRPGSDSISDDEEIKRLKPVLSVYRNHFDIPLSLDTTKASVADFGLSLGASMINDVSGLTADNLLPQVVSRYAVPVVLMHRSGISKTMQENPTYHHIISDIKETLKQAVSNARGFGITDIIIDPGIGFGKTLSHNLALLKYLKDFADLNCPILIGTSRKSFIGAITGETSTDRLSGTIASCVVSLMNGATFFRVHDVLEVKKALSVSHAIMTVTV